MALEATERLGDEIDGAFSLARVERHNRSQLKQGKELRITTPPAQWSYAASLPRWRGLGAGEAAIDPVLVTLRATVEQGCVGFGLLGPDERSFLDEQTVAAGSGPATVELVAGPLGAIARVMVRNVAESGAASVCTLHSVSTRPAAELVLGDELPPPQRLALRPDASWSRHYGGTSRGLEESLRRRAFARLQEPRPMAWLDGLRIWIHPESEMCRAIFVSGVYEPNSALVMLRLIGPGDVVIDAGANMGAFTLLAARRVGAAGRVLAFEPSPRDRARLEQNVALNQLENVVSSPIALWDRPGTAVLRVAADLHGGHNTLGARFGYEDVAGVELRTVETATLDDQVAHLGIERLALVKLDVEGSEIRCLHGAKRTLQQLRPVLLFEVSARSLEAAEGSVAELERTVRAADYALFEIDPESARLVALSVLAASRSENVVAVPTERAEWAATRAGSAVLEHPAVAVSERLPVGSAGTSGRGQ